MMKQQCIVSQACLGWRIKQNLTFDFSRRMIVWVVNTVTDLLSSKVTLIVGNAA